MMKYRLSPMIYANTRNNLLVEKNEKASIVTRAGVNDEHSPEPEQYLMVYPSCLHTVTVSSMIVLSVILRFNLNLDFAKHIGKIFSWIFHVKLKQYSGEMERYSNPPGQGRKFGDSEIQHRLEHSTVLHGAQHCHTALHSGSRTALNYILFINW